MLDSGPASLERTGRRAYTCLMACDGEPMDGPMEETRQLLLGAIDDAFDGEGWHGPTLLGTIRGLSFEQICRPSAYEGITVWQVALHCAYWKWEVRRRVSEEDTDSFRRIPEDWPDLPEARSAADWEADLALLIEEHYLLREAVGLFPMEKLGRVEGGNRFPYRKYIYGAAAHDVYHTAQIRNMGVAGLR